MKKHQYFSKSCCILTLFFIAIFWLACQTGTNQKARQIIDTAGVTGGFVVHLGCGDGILTAALRCNASYTVHGLDADSRNVQHARKYLRSRQLYGPVAVEQLQHNQLPYIDNMVNLLVAEDLFNISLDEIERVLCPNGVAMVKSGDHWHKIVKPRSPEMDDWSHYLHDPSGNPVSHDSKIALPRRFQWLGSPLWARHHDHLASLSALVSSGGRIFYIMDEGSNASILLPSRWSLIARDAFNGTILWKQPIDRWHPHLWPLKSGPAQLPRRLVAVNNRIYCTLGIDAPVSMLDAATGMILHTYPETRGTEEILGVDGVLYLLIQQTPVDTVYSKLEQLRSYYGKDSGEQEPRLVMAIEAATGKKLWTTEAHVLPITLALDQQRLFFHNGQQVVCLDRTSGLQLWQSKPIGRAGKMLSFFAPTLVVYRDVVLFAGGETAGLQTGSWYTSGEDNITALSATTGEILWQGYHPPSGYRSPEDVLVINNIIWTGETTSGEVAGEFTGRDLYTGEVKHRFTPDVDTYWFHHRCYRSKATERFLMTSRTGIEYIDPNTGHWDIHHWVRGGCLYGIMPANGLVYTPPHPCACYPEAKLNGFCALASTSPMDQTARDVSERNRLEMGPAFDSIIESANTAGNDWPTYRHDPSRSGHTDCPIPGELQPQWQTRLGGQLSSIVVADDKVFVSQKNAHTLVALNAHSGKILWRFTAGAPVDSPPTYYQGRLLFGCADGRVYCLRAADGELIWRFLAAPCDQRLMAFEQLESVWPVHGSVLVQDDVVFAIAGRSMFLDGGMRLYRLASKTGAVISVTVLDERDPDTGENLQSHTRYLTLPVALPDILASDGQFVYMRSQKFDLVGNRLEIDPLSVPPFDSLFRQKQQDMQFIHKDTYFKFLETAYNQPAGNHLFSPTGFLDDSWYHRSCWVYGKYFMGGWNGYYLAGKFAPAGRILVHDRKNVYGFGRKPQFYRWTTPLEYHLFATPKSHQMHPTIIEDGRHKGRLQLEQPLAYYWTNTIPLLVRAMVLADTTLVIAGPPDLIDEEQVLDLLSNADMKARLKAQDEAMQGDRGSLLWLVAASSGVKLAEYQLAALPVWDGMAVAYEQLYLATQHGVVVCFGDGNK